jgi:Flp pilus assembly pilin Flp
VEAAVGDHGQGGAAAVEYALLLALVLVVGVVALTYLGVGVNVRIDAVGSAVGGSSISRSPTGTPSDVSITSCSTDQDNKPEAVATITNPGPTGADYVVTVRFTGSDGNTDVIDKSTHVLPNATGTLLLDQPSASSTGPWTCGVDNVQRVAD